MDQKDRIDCLQSQLEHYIHKEKEWFKERMQYIEKIKELQHKNKLLNCQLNQLRNKRFIQFNKKLGQFNHEKTSKLYHQRVKSDQHQNLLEVLSRNNQFNSNEEIQQLLQNKSQKNSSTTNKSLIYLILDNLKNNYQSIKQKKNSYDPYNNFITPFLSTKHRNNKKIHFRSLTSVNNQIQINNDQQGLEVNINNRDSQNTNIQFIMNLNNNTPNSQLNQQVINDVHKNSGNQTAKNANSSNKVFNFQSSSKYNNLNDNEFFYTFNKDNNMVKKEENGDIGNIKNMGQQKQMNQQQLNISQNINYAYLKKKIVSHQSNLYNHLVKKEYSFQKLFTLRNHLDGVRCIKFRENLLISASEDQTIKIWDLKTMVPNLVVQQTLRGHEGAIMSLDVQNNKKIGWSNKIVSGDCRNGLVVWDKQINGQYEQIQKQKLKGVIWDIQIHQQTQKVMVNDNVGRYLIVDMEELKETFGKSQWYCSTLLSASLERKGIWGWDMHSNKQSMYLEYDGVGDDWINDMKLNGDLVASAHEDRKIRFMDLRTGQVIQTIIGHSDSVSSVAFYFRNNNIFHSGGHDGSLRCWDLRNYSLISEHQAHQAKYCESIHCIESHYNSNLVASSGADSIIKIYKGSV